MTYSYERGKELVQEFHSLLNSLPRYSGAMPAKFLVNYGDWRSYGMWLLGLDRKGKPDPFNGKGISQLGFDGVDLQIEDRDKPGLVIVLKEGK